MINRLRRSLSKTYLSVAAAVVFSTSLSNNATAVTYSETAQRLQTMSYSELREEYLRVGDASFNNAEFPFKVPGPLPLGEEAVGAASPSFTMANRLMRNLSYPFIYNTSWRGKNFYKTDEAIATGACNVDRANSSFTITNKLGFLL